MKKQQQGMTTLGAIFVGGILVFAAIIVMKIAPSYIEYWSVRKILSAMAHDPAVPSMSDREIRDSFDRRADIDDVNSIKGEDLDISKASGQVMITASYSSKVHLFGNLNACMDFNASTGSN